MKQSGMRIRALSMFFVWVLVCAVFVGMLKPEGNAEVVGSEVRITWDDKNQQVPAIYGNKIV
ncbi:MAG: hypothetical protein V3U20_09770, partial [Thermoplasmata archaeon]